MLSIHSDVVDYMKWKENELQKKKREIFCFENTLLWKVFRNGSAVNVLLVPSRHRHRRCRCQCLCELMIGCEIAVVKAINHKSVTQKGTNGNIVPIVLPFAVYLFCTTYSDYDAQVVIWAIRSSSPSQLRFARPQSIAAQRTERRREREWIIFMMDLIISCDRNTKSTNCGRTKTALCRARIEMPHRPVDSTLCVGTSIHTFTNLCLQCHIVIYVLYAFDGQK